MGSNAKKKTTMAKLNRETKLREKRQDKQARKDARKWAAANGPAETEPATFGAPIDASDLTEHAGPRSGARRRLTIARYQPSVPGAPL